MTILNINNKEVELFMNPVKAQKKVQFLLSQGYTEKKNWRKIINRLKEADLKEQAEKNQKPVKKFTITIEWKKSATWGNNPHATAEVYYKDGSYSQIGTYKASGYGYCKESTVIADVFNELLKYKLWEIENDKEKQAKAPYGINFNYDYSPCFGDGIGVNCYYTISEFLNGKFEKIASENNFDVYGFTMLEEEK